MHNGQPNPNLRDKKKALSGSEGLLKTVDLKVMAELWYTLRGLEGENSRLAELQLRVRGRSQEFHLGGGYKF